MCLKVFRFFINPYLGFFSDDFSYFKHFPFKAKEVLYKIKCEIFKNNINKFNNNYNFNIYHIHFSKFDQLLLHYLDALHMQFFCIMALSAKVLGFTCYFFFNIWIKVI
jgi:hypothetical protein